MLNTTGNFLNTPTLKFLISREVAVTPGLVSQRSATVALGIEPVFKSIQVISISATLKCLAAAKVPLQEDDCGEVGYK